MSAKAHGVAKGITIATLKTILESIGLPTSGTKTVLQSRLSKGLHQPRIPKSKHKTRILSIDMGIRNLAFCVADIPPPTPATADKKKQETDIKIGIVAWRRIDMVKEAETPQSSGSGSEAEATSTDPGAADGEESVDPYSPPTLSKTAYTLLTETLLPYRPDIILIERQRWRSSSSAAVQQWTVRVNTLESMLWAILTAMREQAHAAISAKQTPTSRLRPHTYTIHAVDSKSVGRTCLPTIPDVPPSSELEQPSPKSKATRTAKTIKNEKIALLQAWLAVPGPSTVPTATPASPLDSITPILVPLSFTFSPQADLIRSALCSPPTMNRNQRAELKQAAGLSKLDDVTDCFLQAVAWVSWERNRAALAELEWSEDQTVVKGKLETEKAETKQEKKKRNKTTKGKTKKA